jgi:DNA/RNA-binding domain of Phe-tRNA-synthetase-like protein
MRYFISPEVFARYPGFVRAVVVAEGIDNVGESPELAAELEEAIKNVGENLNDAFKDHPSLAAWAGVFRDLGLNPNKFPPSVVNLVKRARSGKELPFINKLVAVFNCISLRHLCPCGGDDLDVVQGDLSLAPAKGDEFYVPLGRPEAMEHPPAGEIIYFDTGNKDVFCRAWCWKNGDRSKLVPSTSRAAINIDIMPPMTEQDVSGIASELSAMLTRYTGARGRIFILNKTRLSFEFCGKNDE